MSCARTWTTLGTGLATMVAILLIAPASVGASPGPAWGVDSLAYPTNFSSADNAECIATTEPREFCDTYNVTVTNVGAKATNGSAVTIEDLLPTGLVAHSVALFWSGLLGVEGFGAGGAAEDLNEHYGFCTLSPVKCTIPTSFFSSVNRSVHGVKVHGVLPDDTLKMLVSVSVAEGLAPGAISNSVKVSGGGTGNGPPAPVSASFQNTVNSAIPPFGLSGFAASLLGPEGAPATAAGSHPYELATKLDLNTLIREDPEGNRRATSIADPRDIVVDLPLGLAGSALAAPTCPLSQLSARQPSGAQGVSDCPEDTIVGHIRSYPEANVSANSPIFNIVPERGVAAEFGYIDATQGSHVLYVTLAPTQEGYVLRTTAREIPQVHLSEITANIYGNPAARDGAGKPGVPTFTAPADCSGQSLVTAIYVDSWQAPGSYNPDGTPNLSDPRWASAKSESPPVTQCEALAGLFAPSIVARAQSSQADSPTGLDVDVQVPQHEDPEGLGTPPLKDAVVTLPEGMTVNPSSANGLQTCSLSEVGMSASGVPDAAAPTCPDASKIGTVELETPALPSEACVGAAKPLADCPNASEREKTPLQGSIYVANQQENPFGSLLAIYIVVDDPRTGVLVKLAGEVKADASTGRLTTVVDNSPQFPFSELRTHFFGGNTASLRTPPACGSYEVDAELTPWSAPQSGPPSDVSSAFSVGQGAGGAPCASPLPFAPAFTAGMANPQAGAFSPFSVSISRQDSEENLSGIAVTTPPGLLGALKNVALCPEPEAAQGECGADALIGEATTAVGAGPDPYWVRGGQVYLTGPYNGGSFGLSIVVPTTAGPYTLTGNGGRGREIVRAAIHVDPNTAQIEVVSDPLPSIIEGIPLLIRAVNVTINRPNFLFGPSNCATLEVDATLVATTGAKSEGSAPYHATNCSSLPFRPTLTASTEAKTSKANGAGLTIKVSQSAGEANIHKVDLQLPLQLPSRLSTLQKACSEAQFNANPAGCPAASVIGTGTARTPVLMAALTGPAYLVSHGNASFPDVEFVLQADERGGDIEIVLDGKTDIKRGITYSRFETVPDAPITSFETVLPEGNHSILATNVPDNVNRNLCGQHLSMPTTLVGQNGIEREQTTAIAVAGCPGGPLVLSHSMSRRTLAVTVYLPSAGKLVASGRGVTRVTTKITSATTVTVKLKPKKRGKLATRVTLSFMPRHGKAQKRSLRTRFPK